MKIAIISTHSFPVPYKNHHTGDHFYAGLAKTLDELGHEVSFVAPKGSYIPPNGQQLDMPASYAAIPPTSQDCEIEAYNLHREELEKQDIIHDFSITKQVCEKMSNAGFHNFICTPMGGSFSGPNNPINFVVHSSSMRDRWLVGGNEYKNTPFENLIGPPTIPIKEAHIVNLGIDTDFYSPIYEKKNYFLWLGRWNPVRGYGRFIELAKCNSDMDFVLIGERPENEVFEYQKNCALEAISLAKGYSNIHFEYLPLDPDHHTTKRKILQETKALINTTLFHEPFGLTMAESLSCATPIISTNYGSMPEIIDNNLTGFVLENTIENFSNSLKNINQINNYICREQAVKRFDRFIMAKNYINEYRKILNKETW